ncbi:MAG: type II toxin-antitoxin system VapC family toxin [Magnetococcus sp. WYHC-3]
MIVYLDSSVVMRQLLGGPARWQGWGTWEAAYSSVIMRIECLRTADRLRMTGEMDDEQRSRLGAMIETVCDVLTLVPLDAFILNRAAQSFPTVVGTLDALHLATTLSLSDRDGLAVAFATHDHQQARAAMGLGLHVLGCS